jgi:hypothetical protein
VLRHPAAQLHPRVGQVSILRVLKLGRKIVWIKINKLWTKLNHLKSHSKNYPTITNRKKYLDYVSGTKNRLTAN